MYILDNSKVCKIKLMYMAEVRLMNIYAIMFLIILNPNTENKRDNAFKLESYLTLTYQYVIKCSLNYFAFIKFFVDQNKRS